MTPPEAEKEQVVLAAAERETDPLWRTSMREVFVLWRARSDWFPALFAEAYENSTAAVLLFPLHGVWGRASLTGGKGFGA